MKSFSEYLAEEVTFTKWSHPSNGSERIYVNNLPGARSTKLWIEKQPKDSFGSDFSIKANAPNMTRSEVGNLKDDVEKELNKQAGHRVNTWDDVIKLVKK